MNSKNNSRKLEYISVFGLILAALLWGVSYPATKVVEDYPTFYILSIRFFVASLALIIISVRHLKDFNKETLKYAFILSFCIALIYIFNTVGIKYTTSARASFFTCLSFIIVPFINLIVYKVRISKITKISVSICLVGIFLLSYSPDMNQFGLNLGDILCVLTALLGSINIIVIGKITTSGRINPILFTTLEMIFVAIWSTLVALFNGDLTNQSPTVFHFGTIVFLGLFCCAASFLLQAICQKYVPANRAGIIFAMEPASGCIISVLVLREQLGIFGWIGAITVMISLIYMEVATSKSNDETLKYNIESSRG